MTGEQRAGLSRAIERAAVATGVLGAAALLVISLATVADIVLRLVFNAPIVGLFDVQQMLLLVVIGACFPLASISRQHVSVSILTGRMPRRAQALFAVLRSVFLIAALSLFAWQISVYALDQWERPVYSQHLGWPLYTWWLVCAGLLVFSIPAELVALSRSIRDFAR